MMFRRMSGHPKLGELARRRATTFGVVDRNATIQPFGIIIVRSSPKIPIPSSLRQLCHLERICGLGTVEMVSDRSEM